jgi:predicted Zn-dependent peptidase
MTRRLAGLALLVALAAACGGGLEAQDVGRRAVERLRYPPLRFDPPEPEVHELPGGIQVYLLEDRALPLVSVIARFQGGYSHYGRPYYAAGTAMPGLLRSGGTLSLAPDSVDRLLEYYAVQTTFGGAGESVFAAMNTLTEHLDTALEIWGDIVRHPRFDSARLEVWRGQELENVSRREDDPARLAFSEFNELMFGDHPIGWEMDAVDLSRERLSPERMRWLYDRLICPAHLALGVTGDVSWEEIRPGLEALVAEWAPCPEPLPEPPPPVIRREIGVFLIPRELEQSTIVLAHATDLRQEDTRDYYASRIGNAILGASGFSSRLLSRVRTEEGLAYSASSLWTTPVRHGGIVGATTRTKGESTVATILMVQDILREMTRQPPSSDEVDRAVEEAVNGFVFNFDSPSQVISRRMFYDAVGLPADWLERYVRGIQRVRPDDVLRVFRRHVHPERLVILVVGDPERFDLPLETLGPVTVLEIDGEPAATSPPSGSPRSPG